MAPLPDAQEIKALRKALTEALQRNETLGGDLRVLRTERDVLKEPLNHFLRKLFDARGDAAVCQGEARHVSARLFRISTLCQDAS